MKARFYTFLFAIFPKKYQEKLWDYLADTHGYTGLHRFGNCTMHVAGTKFEENDIYKQFVKTGKSTLDNPPSSVIYND